MIVGPNRRSLLSAAIFLVCSSLPAIAQFAFPTPDFRLDDVKHKEPKSGVELRGNQLTIRSGVGTPTAINALGFSRDGTLLAAAKDFGRVVIWNVSSRSFVRAIETSQGSVSSVAISPDNRLIATGGLGSSEIKVWRIGDGTPITTIETIRPGMQRLIFSPDSKSLIVAENQGSAYVVDANSGKHVVDFAGERMPVLSNDGQTLLTTSNPELVVRSAGDWHKIRTLRKLTPYVWPFALDTARNVYLFGDPTDENSFVAVDFTSGDMLPNPRPVKLPRWNSAAGGFASLDPTSGLAFGHSDARLWAWSYQSGKTCVSDVLFSESGALSSDGILLAGAIDNSILTPGKNKPGVLLWRTANLRSSCGMSN